MPCDQVITQSIEFKQGEGQLDLVEAALKAQGYQTTRVGNRINFGNGYTRGNYANGKFETESGYGDRFNVDKVKRSFGEAVVRKAAKQYGWKVVDEGNFNFRIEKN